MEKPPEGIIISSVVPGHTKVFRKALKGLTGKEPLIASCRIRTGLKFNIPNPEKLGSDRIANAAAAYEYYKCPVAVVDFGTATTISIVERKAAYIGGAIMPGIRLMNESLAQGTSKLSEVHVKPPISALGNNTVRCILSGLFYGTAGAIERVLSEIEKFGKVGLRKILKIFPEEVSRSQLLLWKRKGLLNIDAEVEDKEVKPKFEKMIRHRAGGAVRPLSKKQTEILKWMEEKSEVPYSELSKKFKSPSKAIQSLHVSGLIAISFKEVLRDLSARPELKAYPKPELTPHQEIVLHEILKGIRSKRFSPFLLHGVTGSGKTEIDLRAIEEVLSQGREAIVLVPEISLTPQLLSRFKDRFGENLGLLHSGLSRGERYDQWRRIWKGEVKIALGARSAIFAPFKKVGIIVVDEEHDPSYKQEEKLKYHARDLATVRSKQDEVTLLLGTATPPWDRSIIQRGESFVFFLFQRGSRGNPCLGWRWWT